MEALSSTLAIFRTPKQIQWFSGSGLEALSPCFATVFFCKWPKSSSGRVRRLLVALGLAGEELGATLGHAYRVLELGREGVVLGDGGPAVLEDLHRVAAGVDHRLDGEQHAGPEDQADLAAVRVGVAEVADLGRVVEDAAEPVADEVAH